MIMTRAPIIFWGTMALVILVVWYIQHQRWQPEIDRLDGQIRELNDQLETLRRQGSGA
jgi:uncharacterized membrane protein YjfL (UPF0719 family)